MTNTLIGTYGGSSSSANTICDVTPQRKINRAALAASFVLIVSNTAAEAEVAKPKSFDVSLASTSASAPTPASTNSVAKVPDTGDEIITQIRQIGMLNDGWHREGSRGASQAAVDEAERFARLIDWQQHRPPVVSLTEDGEINLLWQADDLYLDVGFVGDRTYTFFGKARDGRIFHGDDLPVSAALPEELLALMGIQA